MIKRLGAAFIAAASVSTVMVTGAGTASAAAPCGTYPPGLGYSLQRAPYSGKVKVGTTVGTRGTLRRGGQACVGYRLGLYFKASPTVGYKLSGSGVTDSTGSVRKSVVVKAPSRIFYNFQVPGTPGVRSGISEFTIRK